MEIVNAIENVLQVSAFQNRHYKIAPKLLEGVLP